MWAGGGGHLYLNSGAGPRRPRRPSSLFHPKTPYCRTEWPLEPFWPPRCHLASQSDPRTLKRGCSSLPRGHQCAPKWPSGAPQSRRVPRKCCSRPPRDRQCTQKCCPGPLQSRQGMQKHTPSLHHCEKTADSSFLAALRSKALLEIGVFASVFFFFSCFRFRHCVCMCLLCRRVSLSFLLLCESSVSVSVSLFTCAAVFVYACFGNVGRGNYSKYCSKGRSESPLEITIRSRRSM